VHIAGSLHGNAVDEILHPRLVFIKDLILRGAKPAGREAVDGDAVRPPVIGKAHGKLANAAAAGTVRRKARITEDAGNGADVDDAAVAMLHHSARDGLRDKEGAAQIGVKYEIPIVPRDIERGLPDIATGVVHQDVDLRKHGVYLLCHAEDAGLTAHIERDRMRAAAE
jgi:hypothetical protein